MNKNSKMLDLEPMCSLEEFRAFPHGVDLDGILDPELKQLFTICGYWLQGYVDKPILEQTYTDCRKGNGTNRFSITYPAKAIISAKEVREKDDVVSIALSDIRLDNFGNYIENKSSNFYGEYTYEVKYRTGESILAQNVRFALYFIVADYINARDYDGMKNVKLDTITVYFDKPKTVIPVRAQALLASYIEGPKVL